MIINSYPYKYEMHLHTSEASACAGNTGAEMVRAHKEAGYSGIFVTDHAWGGNTAIDRHLPYKEWVREFSKGYYNALREGDKVELDVFFGWEAGFRGTEFLIYGLTPQWLENHEELWEATIEDQFRIIHDGGGMVSHAHPFREEYYIPEIRLFPDFVDAVEIANATHSNPFSKSHNNHGWDIKATEYAIKYNKAVTAGSDVHTTFVLNGGVSFKEKKTSAEDVVRAILAGEDYIVCDGNNYLDKKGRGLEKIEYSNS